MTDDPIVAEVHETRVRLLAEHNGSVARYLDSLKRRRAEEPIEEAIRDIEEFQRRTMRQA